MPKLNEQGPEGKGKGTGRKLGPCSKRDRADYDLGEGMGLARNRDNVCNSETKGKRRNTYKNHI